MAHCSEKGSQTQAAEEHIAVGVKGDEASLSQRPKTHCRKTAVLVLRTHIRIIVGPGSTPCETDKDKT